ncbi:MAG: aminotransferase class III-fold pyridoxal phosphate-dependent enzyme [Roseovarius sp.]|jgi:adenosylmethionine-8-amino-7-oxononanoate aminotransferase|nr:aminotransferase class III-fold pyridoxal phosphate-dependent enzyme [Roseovarius sp.]
MKDDNFLREMNARHLWQPMAHPGEAQRNAPRIIRAAEGVRVTDIDGHSVVDAVGGLWCVNLGYSNDAVKQAISDQLWQLPYYSGFAGTTNPAAIEASCAVTEFFAEDGMERVFFTSGGSDSVDTALRLARQYHRLRGEPARTKFLSLKKGYHGTHWGGASVNGNNRFRTGYEPLLPGCFHIAAPYTYRNPFDESDPARLAEKIAAAMVDEIAFQDPSTIAAFIMEPILGAGGVIVPDASFMRHMRAICDRYGILLISDEVICGFGRTGDWTGARHWGVKPDLMTVAKGITSGYFPVGGVLVSGAVAEVFESADARGAIWTGYTYSAHPVGAAAVVACLAETLRLDTRTNAAARGTQLYEGARRLAAKHDIIGDVRGGHGLMTGIEIVSDRAARTPMDAATMQRIHQATYEAGAMVRLGGHNVLMSPPLVISEAEVDVILAALDAGFSAA